MTFIVLVSGVALGPAPGFVVGATTAVVSNLFFGQGPWTPWQMLAWGLVGVVGGLMGIRGRRPRRWELVVVGGGPVRRLRLVRDRLDVSAGAHAHLAGARGALWPGVALRRVAPQRHGHTGGALRPQGSGNHRALPRPDERDVSARTVTAGQGAPATVGWHVMRAPGPPTDTSDAFQAPRNWLTKGLIAATSLSFPQFRLDRPHRFDNASQP